MTTSTRAGGGAPDLAAPLDLLLTDAAIGIARRFRPAWSLATVGRQLAARPGLAAGQGVALARQLGAVITGRSDLGPEPRDRRFADPPWTQNPLLRRAVQGFVATATAADHVVDELALEGTQGERVRFAVSNLIDAAAPSNNPLLNPTAVEGGHRHRWEKRGPWRQGIHHRRVGPATGADDGRARRLRGRQRPWHHSRSRRPPTELYELIQFRPQTPKVHTTPLLIVPPTINKYYVLDLVPGRSLIEFLVGQGHQVFTISWRNPDASSATVVSTPTAPPWSRR